MAGQHSPFRRASYRFVGSVDTLCA